ncbi:unnamed protein product [Peniophora sp. CBMAI 1063]|nr:unnamed protein product [Peniophora sp. CBMAI 1063]
MAENYLFTFHPTFTQGLVLGQLSILVLLVFVLKYLFLDTSQNPFDGSSSYRPRSERDKPKVSPADYSSQDAEPESTEWFNAALLHVAHAYRSKLRDDMSGAKGDSLMRQRIEDFINRVRPKDMLDPVQVHAVDLGISAPRLSNARFKHVHDAKDSTEFDLTYIDTVSVSISTAYLFNYPMFAFARLPVSLTISLSLFACSVIISPPIPNSPAPALTITVPPTFTLDLKTTSLLGSRAKLADVPKLHELIVDQIKRQIVQRGSIKIPLPGLASVAEVKEEVRREMLEHERETR